MKGRTIGALDMGGASTQITFAPPKSVQKSAKLKLYGKEYAVYTHSFLCFGMKEAQRRFLAQLVKVNLCLDYQQSFFFCDTLESLYFRNGFENST